MLQILNYIKKGKGLGLLIVLAAAVLSTIAFMIAGRYFYNEARPQIMLVAEDFLPITVKGGKIAEPLNTYKQIELNLGRPEDVFPVVLDTRAETSQIPSAKQGLFIMTDKIYAVSPTQTRIFNLTDGVWDKEKFDTFLDNLVGIIFGVLAIICIAILFLVYLFKTWIVSVFGLLSAKIMKKDKIFDFSALMRLSALLVCIMEIIGLGLNLGFGLNITGMQIFFLAVIAEAIFIKREKNDITPD